MSLSLEYLLHYLKANSKPVIVDTNKFIFYVLLPNGEYQSMIWYGQNKYDAIAEFIRTYPSFEIRKFGGFIFGIPAILNADWYKEAYNRFYTPISPHQ